MAVAGARLLGAGKIIAIGTRPNCVELAKEYGATDIVSYLVNLYIRKPRAFLPEVFLIYSMISFFQFPKLY